MNAELNFDWKVISKHMAGQLRKSIAASKPRKPSLFSQITPQCESGEIKRIFNDIGDLHERVLAAGWHRIGKRGNWFAIRRDSLTDRS